jgi:hypothetical protein
MSTKIRSFLMVVSIFFTVSLIRPAEADAQCPMCRISAESNLKNGGTAGKGLNKGILYLFFTPYLVVGTLGFLWWRNNKLRQKEERSL